MTFSALDSTMTGGTSMMVVSATNQLRGGMNLVGRLAGVGGIVGGIITSTPRRMLLILSNSANRGTFRRTGRFALTARIATVTVAGLSKATGKNIMVNVSRRFGVPMGCVKLNRNVRSVRMFHGGRFMSSLFKRARWWVGHGAVSVVALKYSGGLMSSRGLVHRLRTGNCGMARSSSGPRKRVTIVGAYNFVNSTGRRSVGVVLRFYRTGRRKGLGGLCIVNYLSRECLGRLTLRVPRMSGFCNGFG